MSSLPPVKSRKKRKNKQVSINLEHTKYEIVAECVEEVGWKISNSLKKNLVFWCDCYGTVGFASKLNRWQFYNHFPGMGCIAHKVELARTYESMAKSFPDVYNFHPKTYVLPNQHLEFKHTLSKSASTFIIKPDRGSQGKGIILVQNGCDVDSILETSVAQEYIEPFLLDGLKFDMRIYVLVTSISPLRIYIHDEGMVRFCTEKYNTPRASNLSELYSHLTNFSLNKNNENFMVDEDVGHKRSLSHVFKELEQQNIDTKILFERIKNIVRFTLLAGQPYISSCYHTAINVNDGKSRCFEILGFDIILDSSAKPWLLEVNCMPSLTCGSQFDHDLKKSVILGALKILDISPNFRKECMDRFKKMSAGNLASPVPKLFDAENEYEKSKNTKWEQITPYIAENEYTQMYDRVINAIKKKKEGRTAIRRESQPKILQPNKSLINKIIQPKPFYQAKTPKPIDLDPTPVTLQQQLPLIKFSGTNSTAVFKEPATYVAQRRPNRSFTKVSVQEISIPKSLIDRQNQIDDTIPFPVLYCKTTTQIKDTEERERKANLRRQAQIANQFNMLSTLKEYLHIDIQHPYGR